MTARKKAATKKAATKKKEAPENTITVSNLCRELEIDPKKGRAKLRKEGWSAKGKTYPPLERGSKRYEEAVEILEG